MRNFPPLVVDPEDAELLRARLTPGSRASAMRRARIVLLAGAGMGPAAIADELGCSTQTVVTWRERYRTAGVAGLSDAPRSGRPPTLDEQRVITRTLARPPSGTRWSTRLIAAALGVSNVTVATVWRSWGIWPGENGGLRFATEPALIARVDAVVAMHVGVDEHVLAMATDGEPERPRADADPPGVLPLLQALDRMGGDPAAGPADLLAGLAGVDPRRMVLLAAPGGRIGGRAVDDRLAAQPEITLHTVASVAVWARIVHVICGLTAGTPAGAKPVTDLLRALDEHLSPKRPLPFRWTASA